MSKPIQEYIIEKYLTEPKKKKNKYKTKIKDDTDDQIWKKPVNYDGILLII